MAQPFTGERFLGDGESARYDGPGGGHPIHTRACDTIEKAVVFTTSPHHFSGADLAAYRRVEDEARLARYGTDCYAYCMLASGFVDAVIESELNPYDILPLIPIIEGAGGIVTDWRGNPPPETGQVVASGDARLHEQILKRLAG
jgi:myo-inositol-1(or 4)-monophosphatase